ncbi:MAG: c-type cytochrome [Methylocystis sp.]|jgi:cytochrome c|nr:c-type cytochrome [Methylocystis sp.]MCA3587489.1 c-type cytochrome [Methylocystis sp.]MCA3591020.1 c-type cytochrome [Methylocystis sp.]
MRSVLLGVAFLSACCATASAHGPGSHATPPTQEAIAAGDAARGGIAFEKVCSACHTIEKGARRRVGPNLFAVAGARIAQKEGYPYSEAFRKADITWDDETLGEFLAAPAEVVPGTKMDWSVKETQQIADIIAYLKSYR